MNIVKFQDTKSTHTNNEKVEKKLKKQRRSNQSILKEISPGCSLGGTDAKAETPVLWPPHAKS